MRYSVVESTRLVQDFSTLDQDEPVLEQVAAHLKSRSATSESTPQNKLEFFEAYKKLHPGVKARPSPIPFFDEVSPTPKGGELRAWEGGACLARLHRCR